MVPTAQGCSLEGAADSRDQHAGRDSMKLGDRHKDQATAAALPGLDASITDCDKGDSSHPIACQQSTVNSDVIGDQGKRSSSPFAANRQTHGTRAGSSPTKRAAAGLEATNAHTWAPAADAYSPLAHAAAAPVQQQPGITTVAVRLPSLSAATTAGGDGSSSSISPSQQQPRGWAAMLPSPKQEQEDNEFAADGSSGTITQQQDQGVPLSLPCLSPTDGPSEAGSITDAVAGMHLSSGTSSIVAQRFISPTRPSGRPMRPAPLVVPNHNTRPSSNSIGAEVLPAGSSRLSQSQVTLSPAGAQYGSAAYNRLALVSPLGAGCHTPTGLLSPNALARPYSGPALNVEDLDLDAIDDVPPANEGISVSNSSSPIISAPGSVMRSGGLRASRDQDLRRCALMNMLSPRPASMPPASPSIFTGETRARALGTPSSNSSCSSTPVGAAAAGTVQSAANAEAVAPTSTTAERMQQLLGSNSRPRTGSPALTASPVGGSILDQSRPGSRSMPATPASRYNVAAQLRHAGGSGAQSVSSSMTASPVVPPPSHGPAAALLAGSVVASPRTPRSPLSMMFSPGRTAALVGLPSHGQMPHSGTASPLPPPLFGAGGGFNLPSSAGTAPGSARVIPMSPGSSRLSATASPTIGITAEPAGPQQQCPQPEDEGGLQPNQPVIRANPDEVRNSVPIALEITSDVSLPQGPHAPEAAVHAYAHGHGQQPGHLAQVLRHTLQLHDTRLGPHGESPLSPSHHGAMLHQQHRTEGGLRLSPTRPTPLVPPALATAGHQLNAPASPAFAGLMSVFSRSDSGTAAEAAAVYDAAAAADASEVTDVGRMDVHEWLDQHSWPFRYELPPRLRDAAEMVHGQGGMAPPGQVSVTAAGPSSRYASDAGQFWLQQQGLMRVTAGGIERNQLPATCLASSEPDAQHMVAAALPAGRTPVRPCVNTASSTSGHSQRNSLTQLGHEHAAVGNRPHSRLGDVHDGHRSNNNRLETVDCNAVAAGRSAAAAAGHVHVSASSRADDSLLSLAATGAAARMYAAAAASVGDSQHAVSQGETSAVNRTSGPGAAHMPSTPLQQQQSPAMSRSPRHGSSSVRLLSPGSHRYTAGSPVAQDSCCCSCSPAASPQPGPVAVAAAAPVTAHASGAYDSRLGVHAAVGDAAVDPSPVGSSMHQHLLSGWVPSVEEQLQQIQQVQAQRQRQAQLIQQQRQHHSRAASAASALLPVPPSQQNRASLSVAAGRNLTVDAVFVADTSAGVSVLPDSASAQLQLPAEVSSIKGLMQPADSILGSCSLDTRQHASGQGPCSSGTLQTAVAAAAADTAQASVATAGAATAEARAAAAAAQGEALPVLLGDGKYLSRLLGGLPGVDPASAVVQQAIKDLHFRAAVGVLQQQEQHGSSASGYTMSCDVTAPGGSIDQLQ